VQRALHTRALGTKFTTEIEAEIAELAAGWPELISLGSGDPDLDTPAHIRAAATAAIDNGATHYTPHNGLPELRAAISNYLSSSLGLTYAPDEICTTSGVQEALMVTMLALVGPGDEILCPVPTYSVYLQQAALLGAKIVEVPCEPEDDFIMMPQNVEKLITPRTKVLIHMSPNNPTGAGEDFVCSSTTLGPAGSLPAESACRCPLSHATGDCEGTGRLGNQIQSCGNVR
jgi:aspartate/methionine/tyrosine aminotransferase